MVTSALAERVRGVLALPRRHQRQAIEQLLSDLPPAQHNERWNSRFGRGSLFHAWTSSSLMAGLYAANADVVRERLDGIRPFQAIDVGGGDGSLWGRVLNPSHAGTLTVIDPVAEVFEAVQRNIPDGVRLDPCQALVQDADLPEADLIVCSLTLHHVAGADAAERAAHGLSGPGKLEVLVAFREALQARGGLLVLNEADVHCDVELAPGDPLLADRLIDSYVRRAALALLADVEAKRGSADMCARWEAVARAWSLEQIQLADVPLAERDVYELDVPRWLALLQRAGFEVVSRQFTDAYGLFCQYTAVPA
jgi:hypothetical protein